MRIYTDEAISEIKRTFWTVEDRADKIAIHYTHHAYRSPRGAEFAQQGFVRRVRILQRCIQNVFELIPPDTVDRVPLWILADTQINIQAFYANVYGCSDNLAWVWAHETGLADKIDRKRVGLRNHNVDLRKTLSVEMQAYLTSLDQWFAYIVDYRDALAHRIPLYIPERVGAENVDAYNALTAQMTEAANEMDFFKYDSLHAKQEQLLDFQPYITHSIIDATTHVAFHAQMLTDFRTIEEIGDKMLSEIKVGLEQSN